MDCKLSHLSAGRGHSAGVDTAHAEQRHGHLQNLLRRRSSRIRSRRRFIAHDTSGHAQYVEALGK